MAHLRFRTSQNKEPCWEPEKGELVYKVDLAGFPPGCIEMEKKGKEIYLHGQDESADMKHKVRKFEAHVPVIDDVDAETIHITGYANGRLIIGARRNSTMSQ